MQRNGQHGNKHEKQKKHIKYGKGAKKWEEEEGKVFSL